MKQKQENNVWRDLLVSIAFSVGMTLLSEWLKNRKRKGAKISE